MEVNLEMAMFLGLGSRSPKGAPVKCEFEIYIEEIRPWAQSPQCPTTPVIISWRRGSKRFSSSKSVIPLVGRIPFNETFKFPATFVVKKSGKILEKMVEIYLLEDIGKSRRIPKQLASGELHLTDFRKVVEPMEMSIPMVVGSGGPNPGETCSLYLTIRSTSRNGSSQNVSRSSSGNVFAAVTKNVAEKSDEANDSDAAEIESFTDDDDSPRSITAGGHAGFFGTPAERKAESSRHELLASTSINDSKLSLDVLGRILKPFSVTKMSPGESSGEDFDEKVRFPENPVEGILTRV